jgi:hypothetical protein
MVLATIDWTAVGALGTLVLAAVALFALIATVLLWRAALAQVAEVRRDRDLGFQPFIVFETKEPGAVGFGASAIRAELLNIGKGPALTCQFWAFRGTCVRGSERLIATGAMPGPALDMEKLLPPTPFSQLFVYKSSVFAAGAGVSAEKTAENLSWQQLPPVVNGLMPGDDFAGNFRLDVITCRDQLGRKYRFSRCQPVKDEIRDRGAKPDEWLPGELVPPWADGW